jgi:hypothetical protein
MLELQNGQIQQRLLPLSWLNWYNQLSKIHDHGLISRWCIENTLKSYDHGLISRWCIQNTSKIIYHGLLKE